MQSVFCTKDDDGGCDSIKIDVGGEGKIVLDKNSVVGSGCNDASWLAEISASSAEEDEGNEDVLLEKDEGSGEEPLGGDDVHDEEEEPLKGDDVGDEEEPLKGVVGDEEEPLDGDVSDKDEPLDGDLHDEEEPLEGDDGDEEEPLESDVVEEELDEEESRMKTMINGHHLTTDDDTDSLFNRKPLSVSTEDKNSEDVASSSEEEHEEEEQDEDDEGNEIFASGEMLCSVPRPFPLPSTDHHLRLSSNINIKRESGCHFMILPDSLECRRRSTRQIKSSFASNLITTRKRGRGRGRASEERFIYNRGRGGRVIRAFRMTRNDVDPLCDVLLNKVRDEVDFIASNDDEEDEDDDDNCDIKPQLPFLPSSPFEELGLESNEETELQSVALKKDERSVKERKRKEVSVDDGEVSSTINSIDARPDGSDSGVSNPESVASSEPSRSVAKSPSSVSVVINDPIETDINKSVTTSNSYGCESDFGSPERKSFRGVFWRRRRPQQYNANKQVSTIGGSCFNVLSPSSGDLFPESSSPDTADKSASSPIVSKCEVEMEESKTVQSTNVEFRNSKRPISRCKSYLKRELNDLIEGSIKVAKIAALTNGTESPASKPLIKNEQHATNTQDHRVAQSPKLLKTRSKRIRRRNILSHDKLKLDLHEKKSENCEESCLSQEKTRRRKKLSTSAVVESQNTTGKRIRKRRRPFGQSDDSSEGKELDNKLEGLIGMPRATKFKAMQKITELVARKKRAIRMKLALEKRKKNGEDQVKTEEEEKAANIMSSIEAVIQSSLTNDSDLQSSSSDYDSSSVSGEHRVKRKPFHSRKKNVRSSKPTCASVAKFHCRVKIPQLHVQPVKQEPSLSSHSSSGGDEFNEEKTGEESQVEDAVEKPEEENADKFEEEKAAVIRDEDDDSDNLLKRPIGRPRIHRPPQVPSLKPVRLSRNGRRLGRPPARNGLKEEGDAAVPNSLAVRDPSKTSSLPKMINLSLFGSKTSCQQFNGSLDLEKTHSKRSSVRQTECAFRYREIALRKHDNFIQIVLTSTTRVRNGLNVQVLRELKMALVAAKSDSRCNLVLLNGTGSVFCSGIDLISLVNESNQSSVAEATATALREFSKTVLTFPKLLVAAVNGAAVGLGVTILPLFDLVYASDKATFYTPYGKLGHIPEGGATFSLPLIMGFARANGLLLSSRRLTATEALECGLVTQVLWPATFMEEVIPRVQALATQSQTMRCTKALIRYHSVSKLEVTLDTECRMLAQQWASKDCVNAIRQFLQSEEIV